MLITLLTPTGGRKQIFSLSEQWFRQQTIHKNLKHKIQWICVDDYVKEPTAFTCNQEIAKAPKQWVPGFNSHRYNLDSILEKVKGDVLVNWEDDEYYAPDYIESMLKLLETSQIAGISNDRYYHIKIKGYKLINNWKHSSLCRTVLRSEIKDLLYSAVHSGEFYFDINLWERVREKQITMNLIAHSNLSIGIKGCPGKPGLGAGHAEVGYVNDKDLTKFREWIGTNWMYYQPYLK